MEIREPIQQRSLDLRISRNLTLKELKKLIAPVIFQAGLSKNDAYKLRVVNKNGFFILPLKDYAISDGDVFMIDYDEGGTQDA
ncbi:hypothetical protein FC87_GL000857 [Fructilactobacillus florum DSM 22689 = JCM 16035]|uniref:Ubiquitin-like domain-containing protein n=1 Tax=Fructilactobacillus florum DSM 22689 = JCM 16035 TaxID=1423745 RepID=A0A0R2CN18_9LACO|nr:hypothetical protein FC87_GL000857 [Fructilactobacillus florum DSM 22689 = JCM 16035]